MGKEDVFGGVLNSKLTFLDFKNIDFKWLKNLHFSKGFVHGCDQSFEISLSIPVRPKKPRESVW